MSGFLLWTPDAARARASPSHLSRSLRLRCVSRSPCGDGRPSPTYWCCVCPHGCPRGMPVSLCAVNPRVGGWSAPLRRPLREGRRGPGRCSRPSRPSARWRAPVTASVLRMPTGRPRGMPVGLCAASPKAGCRSAPPVGLFTRVDAAQAAAIASGPCAHDAVTRACHRILLLLRAIAQHCCWAVWP